MGGFKKIHQELMNAFPQMLQAEMAEVKKQYPHMKPEAMRLMAMDTAIPQFVMYAQQAMNQQESTSKETKNVKVKRRSSKQEASKNELKFTDAT